MSTKKLVHARYLAALTQSVAAVLLLMPASHAIAGDVPAATSSPSVAANENKNSQPEVKPSDGYVLDRGDKLRIRFFDRYDRDDLNGDYAIGESGLLRLARLGLFEVRGKTTSEVENAVRESVESKGEKLGYFFIDIAECRPIYVNGLANKPGAYPFVTGLTVAHAVSLAGGLYRSPIASLADGIRERSKISEIVERMKMPVARKARLEAERDGVETISVPAELSDLGRASADEFIRREQTVMQRNREMNERERAGLRSMIEFAQSEVDSYDAEIASMNQRLEVQSQLFNRLKSLFDQKIVNAAHFNQSLTALDSVQRDKQLAIAGLARAKGSLEKAKKDLAMLALSTSSRGAKDVAETEAEISHLKEQAEEQRRLATRLDSVTGRSNADEQIAYRIMRRDKSGQLVSTPATETTPLMPGDIIQIDSEREARQLAVK